MNAHGTASVIRNYKLQLLNCLHKIIEIDTICDQNVSRAYAGYHLVVCKPSTRYISLTMKYNMFKGMVHLVGTLQARIQGGGGSEPPTLNFNKQKNKKEVKRERERGQLWG